MLGHLVHWSGVRLKENGVTNHYQNNYVHLENNMEKSIIKLFYKFATNEDEGRNGKCGVPFTKGNHLVDMVGPISRSDVHPLL